MLVGGQSRAGLRDGVPVHGHPRPGLRTCQDAETEARPHPLPRPRVHRVDRRRQDLRRGGGRRAGRRGAHGRHPGAPVRRSAHDRRAGDDRRRTARPARRRAGPGDRAGRRGRLHLGHHDVPRRTDQRRSDSGRRTGGSGSDDRRPRRGTPCHAGARRPVRRRRRGQSSGHADLCDARRRGRHGVADGSGRGRGLHGHARPVPERGHHRRARRCAVGGRAVGGRHHAGIDCGVPDLGRKQRCVPVRRDPRAVACAPRAQALLPRRLPAGARRAAAVPRHRPRPE